MTVDVRLAAANDDLVSIQCVERAAGAPFAAIGMTAVADDEPLPVSSLAKFVADRRCWLAVEAATGRYAGYLLAKTTGAPSRSLRKPPVAETALPCVRTLCAADA